MTPKQADLYKLLRNWPDELVPPSYEEMKGALGLNSKSGIHRLVRALKEQGLIEWEPNRARRIRLIERPKLDSISTPELIDELRRRGLSLARAA